MMYRFDFKDHKSICHLSICPSPTYPSEGRMETLQGSTNNSNFLDGLPTLIFSYPTNLPTACFPYYGQKRLFKKTCIDAFRIKNKIQIFITVFSVLHSSLKIHVFSLLSFPLNLKYFFSICYGICLLVTA